MEHPTPSSLCQFVCVITRARTLTKQSWKWSRSRDAPILGAADMHARAHDVARLGAAVVVEIVRQLAPRHDGAGGEAQ
jgi:hypothetical protein